MTGEGAESRKPDKLPQRLLTAATRLFAEYGFEGTSVQKIVEAAGVTKGALYHYFDSKDDLLRDIYGRVLRMQAEQLEKFATTQSPVAERLRNAAADVVLTSIAHLDDTKIFFRSMHQLSADNQRAVRAARRRYHEGFRTLIEEGQAVGAFRTDVPADLFVDLFFGAVHHLSIWYRHDGTLSAERIGSHFADLLLTSLRPTG
ncbi:TetR/AcrR family transcriptional regulator [Streptomyces luomodiensis]|uniref:TetR/AcrR family transcriptional regulator n=1 Tax=Streptomyces luomodiensis TaxID=3026192 RepID=A0ABY9UN94_9ACTN|nr:TetR/AcrR family transcriptional regulator [Streptomyces sp. SCA4-21]WNE93946.1 TetR/AcrR family transcriptional regulator [Streptomyces sp. SCA4-21]